eukprot:12427481-Karenia_brevis.AAC.1
MTTRGRVLSAPCSLEVLQQSSGSVPREAEDLVRPEIGNRNIGSQENLGSVSDDHGSCNKSDDAEWERRLRKRWDGIAAVQKHGLYVEIMLKCITGQRSEELRPNTPNPRDRSVSKRNWEASMIQWRKDLYSFNQDGMLYQ